MLLKQSMPSQIFQHYLYRKPEPNLSIKLEKPQQKIKHTFLCECQMCTQYDGKKILQILNNQTEAINKKVKEKVQNSKIPSEFFLQILKKLVLPLHKIVKRGIDIYIPQICFFNDGQSKGMFLNRQIDDFTLKKIHKNSINPGLIAKIFNQRRRAYKQYIKKSLGIERRPLQKQLYQVKNKKQQNGNGVQFKDAVIIKYTDGFESILSQTQFIMLTLRRKQDPIWKTIEIIRNTINVQDEVNNIFFVKYEKSAIKYANLIERAKTLTRIYAENIIPGEGKYISNQQQNKFCLQLFKQSKSAFAQYVVYKIVSFIEFFYDQQIHKISCKLLVNQICKPYLIDVTSYKKKTTGRFVWTNDTYKRKMQQQEQKLFVDRAIMVTEQLQQKSESIKQLMEHKYVELKNKYGISLQEEDNEEQTKNNQFFKRLHPEFGDQLISEVLMNDKNISLLGFKKKYLGYKQEKKPIVKDFTTHMIKVLHKTTPKMKIASFHQISFKPNQSGFFSSRRPNTCSVTKRSSFTAITSPTKNLNLSQRGQFYESPRKSSQHKRQKSKQSVGSRIYTSSTQRKQGCHLHMSAKGDSFVRDVLNLCKQQKR